LKRIFLLIIVFTILSCTKSINIEGFNQNEWQQDKNGCEGIRSTMTKTILGIKSELLGLDTDEVISVLGRPNKTILGERSQKKFIYNISPIESCENHSTEKETKLFIRFNAVGLAYEIIIN